MEHGATIAGELWGVRLGENTEYRLKMNRDVRKLMNSKIKHASNTLRTTSILDTF